MTMDMNAAIPGLLNCVVFGLVLMSVDQVGAAEAEVQAAASLSARYEALRDQLSNNAFLKPLYLESNEASGGVSGDVFAVVDSPFATAKEALNRPAQWCDILMLHLNVKFCRVAGSGTGSLLNVGMGRKFDQPPEKIHQVDFTFGIMADLPNYLKIRLDADSGPLSTRDYRFVFEAIPLEKDRTFIHLTYSYGYGLTGRMALQGYLRTLGRNKVGFTVVGKQADGQPRHVGGVRGVVERNSMRYYLAIEAFLGSLSAPPPAQIEKRLHDWIDAVELYPRQLHEMERSEYLEMKRKEIARLPRAVG